MKYFFADFETTKEIPTRVWLWASVEMIEETVKYGHDISTFFEWLESFRDSTTIYFHNLKFDGSFILARCQEFGYTLVKERPEKHKELTTLISDMGQWYSITIRLWYKKKPINITIKDSSKIIQATVADIARSFGTGVIKGTINFDKDRPLGYRATKDEIEYCYTDCLIVSRAIHQLAYEDPLILNKLTIGSYALDLIKKSIKNFRTYFPVLEKEIDDDIRKAYKGGYVYVNPKIKGQLIDKGLVYDNNSMFPYQMRDMAMPIGYPMKFEGPPQHIPGYECFIVYLACDFQIKEGKVPTIQIKNTLRFMETEYLVNSAGEQPELALTHLDLQLFLDHYHVWNVNVHGGYYFETATGLFNGFIDEFMHIKETSQGAKRQRAKFVLNSAYGKFATNPERYKKVPYVEDGVLKFEIEESKEGKPIYTALSCFVTAYARFQLIKAIQANYNRFLYSDTDSLHLKGLAQPNEIELHHTQLGAWDLEYTFTHAKYLRAKTYFLEDGDDYIFKVAGASDEVKDKMTVDNFDYGAQYLGKLVAKQVEGGCILVDTTFKILDDY